jgi:hypothetical protein
MHFLRLVPAIALLSAVIAPWSDAGSIQVRPTSDRDGASQVNADTGPFALRPDGLGSLIVGSGFSGGTYRSGMEFSLASITGQVTQATFSFNIEITSDPPAAYRTHGYAGDGIVTATDLEISNEIAPIQTTTSPPQVDITSFIQSLIVQHKPYAGIVMSGFIGGHGFAITSSEPFVNSPMLTIMSIPIARLVDSNPSVAPVFGGVTVPLGGGNYIAQHIATNSPKGTISFNGIPAPDDVSIALDVADPSQVGALLSALGGLSSANNFTVTTPTADLAMLSGGGRSYDLMITFPNRVGPDPDYFEFDFSGAGVSGAPISIANVAIVPEPATLGLLAPCLFLARRIRRDTTSHSTPLG